MTRKILLLASMLVALPFASAEAGSRQVCRDMPKIQQAFGERLTYETRRAKRRGLPVARMQEGFRNISDRGSCHEVWERHRTYLDKWAVFISRNG
ncbi:MAG: hypothetical protein AAF415_18555 [Pseudomonadota bacterium]